MIDIMITKSYTGHIYYNSPIESDDNCGTCDGARCETCKTRYKVWNYRNDKILYSGFDEKKANEVYVNAALKYCEDNSISISAKDIRVEFDTKEWCDLYTGSKHIALFKTDMVKIALEKLESDDNSSYVQLREKYAYMILNESSILLNEYRIDISEKEELIKLFKSIKGE